MSCQSTFHTSCCNRKLLNDSCGDCPQDFSFEFEKLTSLRKQVFGSATGGICDHQYKVGYKRLEQVYDRLRDCGFNENGQLVIDGSLRLFSDFEELYKTIDDFIRNPQTSPIKNIGELTIYDIATRIGYHQSPKVRPIKYVYLHQGAKDGARHALGRTVRHLEPMESFAHLSLLKNKTAWQIEDCLCICKKKF